jgi:hypothetical protein
MTTAEHPLPAQQHNGAARKAEGFATPKQDKKPQCARMLPKRVLPDYFSAGDYGVEFADERGTAKGAAPKGQHRVAAG